MSKINQTLVLVAILLIFQTKSEAQLNGDYTFDIALTFGTSPYTFGDYTGNDWSSSIYNIFVGGLNPIYIPSATSVHNPKNGGFTIKGTTQLAYVVSDGVFECIQPEYFNPALGSDYWDLTDLPISIVGKTYTDRKSKKSLLDTTGLITLQGTYTPADKPESKITKGSITFKASKLDCNRLYRDTNEEGSPTILITGSVSLANKQIKKFKVTDAELGGLYWGGNSYGNEDATSYAYESFYLELNVSTTGSTISGTAKAYYSWYYNPVDPSGNDSYIQYPDPATPSKEFTYSVKGTSKNGIATLNLTGQGVIKGLKATIYIDESTEEIVQNGKNSITLYGQTITY